MVRINKRNPEGVYQAIAILCILLIKSSSVEGDNVQTSFSVSSGDSPGVTEVSTARGCNHIDAEANKLTIPDPKCAATIGSECTLSCIKNFMTDNSSIKQTVTCTDEGWAPAIRKCKAIQCEPWILLANQVYIIKNCTANRDVKDTCRISCRDGHELETPPPDGKEGYFINCKLNTTTKTSAYWSDKQAPACQAITCPPWELGNNLEIKSGNCAQSRQVSATCEVGCKGNFRFNPPQESKVLNVTCRWNRTSSTAMWVPQHIPTCQAITCTPFKFPAKSRYDMTSCSSNEVGKNCTIRCQSRYKFNDSTTQWSTSCKLQAGGVSAEWTKTNPPICEAITCPPPPIDSNQVFTNSGGCEGRRQLNSHCSIGCGENFKFPSPSQRRTVRCIFNRTTKSAIWTPAPIPECVAYECEKQKIGVAKNYRTSSCPGSKSVGSMCRVSCKSGYRFDDEVHAVNISCKLRLTNGQKVAYWDIDEAPSCKAIKCNQVSLTNHGHYTTTLCQRRILGSQCSIKCETGYTINSTSNEKAITCDLKNTNEFEAEWKIGNAPTCKEITCNDITGRENLKVVRPCGNSINTICDLSCPANHKFPSPWASRDTLQAKCVIAGSGTTADWKIEKSSQTELVTIPERCEAIRCSETAMAGNYKTKICGSASINDACQLQCKNGFKFSDNRTEKDVTCTSNGDKTASWPNPGCIKIKCENVTSSSFGTPADNFKEKRPIPDANCGRGSSCKLSCDNGYSLSKNTLKCDTAVEKWSPHPANVGLCTPTIKRTKKICDYWISGFKTDSNATADNHCRLVLGPTAALAMPRHMTDELEKWIPGADHLLVGAYISGGMPYWNDGITLKGKGIPKSGSGSFCVVQGKTEFLIFKCGSKRYKFMCERPKANNDPCGDESVCNAGNCTAVGCSYRCKCPDMIYGRHCENGPFTKNITKLTKDSVRIYLKNNAKNETARYSIFLNGQEINSSTLEEGEEVWKTYRLHQNERNSFVSLVTTLANTPDVSQSKCLIVKNPNGRDRVKITNDKCDPTVLNVFWEGFGENSGHSTDYSVYVGSTRKESSPAGSWIKLSGLKREKQYNIRVLPTIEGCKNYSFFEVRKVKTSYGGPDAPNITKPYLELAQASITQNCSIAWTVERPKYSAGYTVKFVELDKVTRHRSKEEFVTVAPFMSFHSFRTNPNSIYRISVSTKGPFGCDHVPEKWSNEVSGCETDTSAPSVIRDDLITVSQENKFPRVTLNQLDERNGPVSCYLVIVQVALSSSNSSKVATTINDLKQVNDSVNAGDNYIAIAVKRHEVGQLLHLGNGNMSCCNIRNGSAPCTLHSKEERQKRAASSEDNVRGENRPLDPNQNYRHYVLIATPRTDGGDPILTASPLSDAWRIPKESDGGSISPMTIVFPVVIVILILAVIAGVILYRRRHPKRTNGKLFEANPDNIYEEPIEFVDLTDKSDSIIDEALSNFTFRLRDLFLTLKMKRENEDERFRHEFEKSIPEAVRKCELTRNIADMRVNQPKNRDRNVVPYDRSRVRVRNTQGSESADYINASYIDGYLVRRKYIATQGPKPETIADFWRMVLEQNCRVIVMLTTLKEKSKVKCARYWPQNENEPSNYEGISVKMCDTMSYGDFLKRRIIVTDGDKSIEVVQFHFLVWPDHGIPPTISSVLRLHEYVTNAQPSDGGPIIVHCSSGAGGTGTFIALDILSNQMMEVDAINFSAVVGKIRTKRPDMVQTLEQYMFLHQLVLELYQFGQTDKTISEFSSAVKDMESGYTNIATEFGMLNYFPPLNTTQDHGGKECNRHLNGDSLILPYDHNRAYIQIEPNDQEDPYYNASVVASYNFKNHFIAAQNPNGKSIELFWRTVLSNDVSAIVGISSKSEKYCYWPKVSEMKQYGIVTVRTTGEIKQKGFMERTLEVIDESKKISLLQLSFDDWPERRAPSRSTEVLEMIFKLEKYYQTLSRQEHISTIVLCRDGSDRAGTFCAILNIIERLKNENRIDVFRMAKDLRDLRPGMIGTEEQHEFCYRAVSDYLQLFNQYENFQ